MDSGTGSGGSGSSGESFKIIAGSSNLRFLENSRRMLAWNREMALRRYFHVLEQPGGYSDPEPPLLLQGDGSEVRYVNRGSLEPRFKARPSKPGAGPDRWGYHAVTADDDYEVGDFWHDPDTGAVWCRVETPRQAGEGFLKVWLRIT